MSDAPIVSLENGVAVYRASALMMCEEALVAARAGIDPMLPPDKMQERFDEGHLHEPAILTEAERITGWHINDRQRTIEVPVGSRVLIRGHIDGAYDHVVDAKALSFDYFNDVMYPIDERWFVRWDKVPHYAAQMTVYMEGTGLPGALAVGQKNLEDRTKLERVVLAEFDKPPMSLTAIKARIARIEIRGRRGDLADVCTNTMYPCPFYHVLHNAPPPGEQVNETDVLHALAKEHCDAKDAVKQAESKVSKIRERILQALGERPFVRTPRFSVKQRLNQGRETIDAERLKLEQPEIVEKYTKVGKPYVVLTVDVKE